MMVFLLVTEWDCVMMLPTFWSMGKCGLVWNFRDKPIPSNSESRNGGIPWLIGKTMVHSVDRT